MSNKSSFLGQTPCVMGVINRSPASYFQPCVDDNLAIDTIAKMVAAGVRIIDIGAQATNPLVNLDQQTLSIEQQMTLLIPLIKKIRARFNVLISVDTSLPEVMLAAVEQGAHMINDQSALLVDGALECVVKLNVPVCLMHSFQTQRQPGAIPANELLQQIKSELAQRVAACLQAGMRREQIILDPGFGTGNYAKNSAENFYLLAHLSAFTEMGFPLLVGWSRKSMIGEALGGVSAEQRLYGSIAAATIAALQGAAILRVHDVRETQDALCIVQHYQQALAVRA